MRELAEDVLKRTHKKFIYTAEKTDRWAHHADAVEAGHKFKDDCDGFALTCAELLLRGGASPEAVSLIICRTDTQGHLVCGVDFEGTTWILDNNSKWLRDWNDIPYDWKFINSLNEPEKWRRVTNG